MDDAGVRTYLLLLEPSTWRVLWANENVEQAFEARTGQSPVGLEIEEVIPLGEAVGLPKRLERVERTGEPEYLSVAGLSRTGPRSRTEASIYRLPSGELLVATEYVVVP